MPDVPEEAVDAAQAAGDEWISRSRSIVFTSPARDQVRAMLEAACTELTLARLSRSVRLARIAALCHAQAENPECPECGRGEALVKAGDILAIIDGGEDERG
jgi:hypothetical protein